MSIHAKTIGAAALLAGALLAGQASAQATSPAGAPPAGQPQPQVPNGPVKIDMITLEGTNWTKVCSTPQQGGKELCFTTRDFSTAKDQPPPVALAVYDVKGDDKRIVRVLLPIGLLLKPGVHMSVDKGATTDGSFEFCMPNGCFAEARMNGKSIDSMKKGTTFNIVAKGLANNEVTFALPLANFGKSFDGAPIDPAVLQKQQQDMQAALQKQMQDQATAQRQRLEQSGAAAAAPATPPSAPAAPAKP